MTSVLALNGSPRGERSNTQALLEPFLEGARSAGAETETLIVKDLDIGFCKGCFGCWTSTPGRCVQKDDMVWVLDRLAASDHVVYATPLYHFGMTALLKRLLERTLPLLDPHLVRRGGTTFHPVREGAKRYRWTLIANAGFPDLVHFGPLVEQFRHLTGGGRGLAAAILIPGGEALGRRYTPGGPFEWLWSALRKAGEEVVRQGRLSPETESALARPLVDPETYVETANRSWDARLGSRAVRAE
ncbi:MAG: flavodoxin family protein [Firmicutes bacterium]|nr:flavodoxin family protein [Bacillota bacterium]